MSWPSRWLRRGRILFDREAVEREMDEEMRFHVEMEARENERRGQGPEAARRTALLAFGGVERFKEEARDSRGLRGVEDFLQDLRYGLRALRRSPVFALTAVLTLALGIGANAAIFSVVDSVLVRPLPYREADRLVAVWKLANPKGVHRTLSERSTTLEALDGYSVGSGFSVTGGAEPERLEGSYVTAGLFDLLGVQAAVGRTFAPGEDQPGAERVAVLGHGLWQQRLGGDPEVVGRQITLDGVAHTIVGVMPPDFGFPNRTVRLWVPAVMDPANAGDFWGTDLLRMVGRLRRGVSPAEAHAELRDLQPVVRDAFPWRMPDEFGVPLAGAVPLQEALVGEVRTTLLVLLGAVGLVLLVACANVANLLLARTSTRRREVAVRAAVGASRERLVRQLLTESLLLFALGGAAGVLLAGLSLDALVALLPASTPRIAEIGLDARVLGFALGLSLLTGAGFGLFPALRSSGLDLHAALKEGAAGLSAGAAGRRRLARTLVSAEIALAVVLVTGAGLLVRSLWALERVDPGFRAEDVLTARLSPPEAHYRDDVRKRAFYRDVLERVGALPQVQAAGAVSRIPLGGEGGGYALDVETHPLAPGAAPPWADGWKITPGYLEAMGIRLVEGRAFTEADREDAPAVALVNESFARRFWPGASAVGQRIKPVWWRSWITIVGVVGDVKDFSLSFESRKRNFGLNTESRLEVYRPFAQEPAAAMTLAVRSDAEAQAMARTLRELVWSVDRDVPVSDVRNMQGIVAASVDEPRVAMLLLSVFASLALLLGAIGIYGLVAYGVEERTREIGVRMALGASRGDVLRLILSEGAYLAGAGVAAGLLAALAFSRVLSSLLFGVSGADPATFAVVAACLMAVALLATYLPARRATRVDPMQALRFE
jgi:putative ABC transport system permease protein